MADITTRVQSLADKERSWTPMKGCLFHWWPGTKELGFEPSTASEHFEELIDSGFVDEARTFYIPEHAKKLRELPPNLGALSHVEDVFLEKGSRFDPSSLEYLWDLSALRVLRIHDAKGEIPDGISRLRNLTELTIGGVLTRLPEDLGRLGSLRKLELVAGNKLTALPEDLGELRSLVELEIRSSGIKTLPPSIRGMQRLEKLAVNTSKFRALPEEVNELPKLRVLEVQSSAMSKMPKVLRIPTLETLTLYGNFKKLPEMIDLPNLENLYISANVKVLPGGLLNLPKLRQGRIAAPIEHDIAAFEAHPHLSIVVTK